MGFLNWEKPPRARPADVHNAMYQSDTNIAGTYVPNMSDDDARTWRAKHIGGTDPRVEIRVRVQPWTQVKIVVRATALKLSMNGPVEDNTFPVDLVTAIHEARQRLETA